MRSQIVYSEITRWFDLAEKANSDFRSLVQVEKKDENGQNRAMNRQMLPKPEMFNRYSGDQVVPDSTFQPNPLKIKHREMKRSRSSWRSLTDDKNSQQLSAFNLDEGDDSVFSEN